ncbi:carbohydrate ABC transporter permease [Aestuariimicrobium ganziense]|uniref:carbohydrate ABC transporter permease n=1 Tax=Aestuariimicrobium ganziense TaxID=2773677 RepID=UPI001942B4DC|nr:sugar ABC transporter permease [Aestuariimicrobium ganziense]
MPAGAADDVTEAAVAVADGGKEPAGRGGRDLRQAVEAGTSSSHRAALRKKRMRDNIHGYIFMAPQLIGLLAFMIGPLVFAIILAFMKWDGFGSREYVGFGNFKAVFENEQFIQSWKNTAWFTALQVPALMISAFIFALLLQRTGKMKNFYRACFFAPQVTATVAVSVIWLWLLNPDISPITGWLKQVGLVAPDWLQDPNFVIPAVVLVSVWQGLGYQLVMFMAGLDNVPSSMMEAASIDGANEIQKMFRITLPLISPTILFLSITSIIGSFQVFDYIFVFFDTTAPAFGRTIVYEIVQTAFREFNFGVGAALALLLFMMLLALTGLQLIAQKKWVFYTE